MLVNILVATIDEGINKVSNLLLAPRSDLKYYISHQLTDNKFSPIPEELVREDVTIGQIEGRGLCRNRNNAIAMADGDVAMLADDDVRYDHRYITTVINAFAADDQLDVACFRIATPEGEPEYKSYTEHSYLLNKESHHYISTLEIAFRPDKIKDSKIAFDERFGLGSKLNSFGEEAVFIHDCIKAGLQVKYIPEYVVEHAATSSIKSIDNFAPLNNIFKGAYDARRYGLLAFPASFYGTLQLWTQLKKNRKKPLTYLRERLSGAFYIYRHKRQ